MNGFTENDQERIYNEASKEAQLPRGHRGIGYHPEKDRPEATFVRASHPDTRHGFFTENDQERIYKETLEGSQGSKSHHGLGYHGDSQKVHKWKGGFVEDEFVHAHGDGFTESDQERIYKEVSTAADQTRGHRGIGYSVDKQKFEAQFVHPKDDCEESEPKKDPKEIASIVAQKLRKSSHHREASSDQSSSHKRNQEAESRTTNKDSKKSKHETRRHDSRDGKDTSKRWERDDINPSGALEFQSLDDNVYQMDSGYRKDLQKYIDDEEVTNLSEVAKEHHGPTKSDVSHALAMFGKSSGAEHAVIHSENSAPKQQEAVHEVDAKEVVNESLLQMTAEERKLALKKKIHEMRRAQHEKDSS